MLAMLMSKAQAAAAPPRFYGLFAGKVGNDVTPVDFGTAASPIVTPATAVAVGTGPRAVAVSANGLLAAVSNYDAGTVSILDLTSPLVPLVTRTLTVTVDNGDPFGLVWSGHWLFVVNLVDNNVVPIDTSDATSGAVHTAISLGVDTPRPSGIVVTPNGRYLIITCNNTGNVIVVDLNDSSLHGPYAVGSQPVGIDISTNGLFGYVALSGSNQIVSLDFSGLPTVTVGTPFLVPNGGAGGQPTGIAISHDMLSGLVTHPAWNCVTSFGLSSPLAPTIGAYASVATVPYGIAWAPDDSFAITTSQAGSLITKLNVSNRLAPTAGATASVGTTPYNLGPSAIYTR
jgi:DNA-binding beta-propeller fold protein YncE